MCNRIINTTGLNCLSVVNSDSLLFECLIEGLIIRYFLTICILMEHSPGPGYYIEWKSHDKLWPLSLPELHCIKKK